MERASVSRAARVGERREERSGNTAEATAEVRRRRSSSEGKVAFFMSADKVKFRKPVVPGDQLKITAKLEKVRGNKLATASVECTVNDQPVSSASLMFAIADAGEDG